MSYDLMFQKAIKLHQDGALNEAEQIYRQILETTPDNADILNLLGLIAQAKGFHREAVTYFYRAITSSPKHFPIFFNLAVSLEAIGKHLEAIEAYEKVISLKPDLKEAFYGIANIYWQMGNIENAKSFFEKAINIDNNYTEAIINLAELTNDIDKLQSLAKDNNFLALYYLGRRSFMEKDFVKAKEFLSKADSLFSSDEIKSIYGQCLLYNDKKLEALKIFYQALTLNPSNEIALINIADLETENKNFGEAEKFYKKAININPQNLQAHSNYANMLCKNKRTLEALEEYRKAILISPETPELSYNLAIILKTLEDYEQALSLMFNAYYLAPQHEDWSLNIAETLILLQSHAPEKAIKITENWYTKMPDNIVVKHLWEVINGKQSTVEKEYNKILFDNFASSYDEILEKINYSVIDKIKEIIPNLSGNILDLGCGTGKLAAICNTENTSLTGIDISQKMLDIAQKKNFYKELINSDIEDFLQTNNQKFDYTIAADVFCYFGELKDIFENLPQSKLIFSLEIDENIDTFKIMPNGRYKHNPQYIENLLNSLKYKNIKTYSVDLRLEQNIPVKGAIFCAQKT